MYLVVECRELNDQYECSAERIPLCVTEDYPKYGYGYEIWEVKSDNKLELVKEYDQFLENGIAVTLFTDNYSKPSKVYEKHKKLEPEDIPIPMIKEWKEKYKLKGRPDRIQRIINNMEFYSEETEEGTIVIGLYEDECYYN